MREKFDTMFPGDKEMPEFGIATIMTESTAQPVELARAVEASGLDSMFIGEHSHIPVSRESPFPLADELPEYYKHFFDPMVGLAAAASVTTRIKLGTAILLITEHNVMHLAKQVSCLDRVSNGRVLLGIGGGWNAEEMRDHGVAFKDRWKVAREMVLALRRIWADDEAEFHGEHIDFDPLWSYPKPVQDGGPPILMGASAGRAPKRVAEYCDGWLPVDGWGDTSAALAAIRTECEEIGRDFSEIQLGVITRYHEAAPSRTGDRVSELLDMGFTRILFTLDTAAPDVQLELVEKLAGLAAELR